MRRQKNGALLSLLLGCLLLQACVSYEPAQLVPSLTLSPEEITLASNGGGNAPGKGVDFGLQVAVNESDSLSNLAVLPGVRVRAVTPNGAAAAAGIQVGDVILAIDDLETNQADVVQALALDTPEPRSFVFRLRRNTTVIAATVLARPAAGALTAAQELFRVDPILTRAGYRTEVLQLSDGSSRSAVRVVELFPQSPLPAHGLAAGDLLLALDGSPLQSAQGLIDRLHNEYAPGAAVSLSVYRNNAISEQKLRLWDPGRRISRVALGPLLRYEHSLAPDRVRFAVLDLWLFAVYRYTREGGERAHSLLGLINFTSGYGNLVEDSAQ
ncbi:MAG: PDZ domain-containing protein [Pseudomonadales bacterium]|nr:PDZ domain-containing protein [Pseudomonadales bacterium]